MSSLITNLVACEDILWHSIESQVDNLLIYMVKEQEHEKIHLKRESHCSSFLWSCPPYDTCQPACPRRPRPRPARRRRTWPSTGPPRAASTRTCDMTREDVLVFSSHSHDSLCCRGFLQQFRCHMLPYGAGGDAGLVLEVFFENLPTCWLDKMFQL